MAYGDIGLDDQVTVRATDGTSQTGRVILFDDINIGIETKSNHHYFNLAQVTCITKRRSDAPAQGMQYHP